MPETLPAADSGDRPASATGGYGLQSLTLLVVASMVGSGVFTTSGFTLGAVGSPARVLVCWLIAGGIAICGAVAYGQLARLMPHSGGEYLYLSRNVHPIAGFLAGWVSLTAGFSGAIAIAAVAFEQYAVPTDARPDWLPPDTISIVMILLCAAAHGWNTQTGRILQDAAVVLKVIVLAGFLLFAASCIPTHPWQFAALDGAPDAGVPLITAVATSLVWISLSYAGFNAAIYVASESSEAGRLVPRALIIGTILVTLLYLVLNLIFVTAVPAEELAWQEPVAAIAATHLGGEPLELFVRTAVCLGLLTSVSSMIMTGPRVYARMADDGVFPNFLSAERGGIPRSITLQAGISIGLILAQRVLVEVELLQSSLLGLLIYLGSTLSISSACCALTIFLPKVRRQMTDTHFARDILTAVYAVCTLAAVAIMVMTHKDDGESRAMYHLSGIGLTIVTGLLCRLLFKSKPQQPPDIEA